jgi:hypothetical protein
MVIARSPKGDEAIQKSEFVTLDCFALLAMTTVSLETQMFLKLSAGGALTFEDRNDFRAFKLVVEGDRGNLAEIRRAVAGKAELLDAETAWIYETALRSWSGVAQDTECQQDFSAMIEKARPHGWIDAARKAIKAHIEWVPAR